MKTKLLGLIACMAMLGISLAATTGARASTFSFSFTGDLSIGNTDTITGLIFGLTDNGSGQSPTSAEITSAPTGVGVILSLTSGTFDVSSGNIVAAHFAEFFSPSPEIFLYFNDIGAENVIVAHDPSYYQAGNSGGFIGATYAEVSSTPLPAALPLFATGLGGLGLLGWRRKRKNTAAIAAA
jgi:hypothetical protein